MIKTWGALNAATRTLDDEYRTLLHRNIAIFPPDYMTLLRPVALRNEMMMTYKLHVRKVPPKRSPMDDIMDGADYEMQVAAIHPRPAKDVLLAYMVCDAIAFLRLQAGYRDARDAWIESMRNTWSNTMLLLDIERYLEL